MRDLPLNYQGLTTVLESVLDPLRGAEQVRERLTAAHSCTIDRSGAAEGPRLLFVSGWESIMLVIKRKGERFTVRAAGVCVRDDHVLLQTEERMDFWVLPGGRNEMGERTADTLQREMWEETGLEVAVGGLLWVMENFYQDEGKAFHEISFYYQITLPKAVPPPRIQPEFTGMEGEKPLTFRWFPLADVADVRLFPTYFRHALRELPTSPVHVVHHDVDE